MLKKQKSKTIATPTDKFDIVYADPPWQYATDRCLPSARSRLNGVPGEHYPTMTQTDIQALDVLSICAPDAICFMWVVSPKLDDGIDTLRAWGFKYSTIAFVWHKQRHNPGYYTLSECEICIVGKRGKFPTPRGARNVRQFLSEAATRHSAKPSEIRDRISLMFPTQNKVELFARNSAPGWSAWGNEVPSNIVLPVKKEI